MYHQAGRDDLVRRVRVTLRALRIQSRFFLPDRRAYLKDRAALVTTKVVEWHRYP